MDRRRMDADGGRVVHRDRRTRKLAVVVVVQNVLVAACLLVTLYVYWDAQGRNSTSGDDVHIQFETIADIMSNGKLQFTVYSSNKMSLTGVKNDTISINCTGPYMLYIYMCYKSLNNKESKGILQLHVAENETPVSSLNVTVKAEVCTVLHSIAYLKAKEEASVHTNLTEGFKIKNVTVGLNYLLGGRCER